MKTRHIVLFALGITLLGQPVLWVEAARKYYPPGFTPDAPEAPAPNPEPAPSQVIIQQVPGVKQVIIKTVPVVTVKRPTPKDPLQVLVDDHRYYDALRMVDARLKKTPNNLTLQLLRGKILREEGHYDQAVSQFESILEKSRERSTKASAFNGIGWTYYQKALHRQKIGDATMAKASLVLAESAFKQACDQAPNMPYPWAGLTRVYLASNRMTDAIPMAKKSLRLAPNNLEAQLANAELLLAENKSEDALQALYGLKKATTYDPDVFLLLARASLKAGKVDDAIINLKQLLEIFPEHTEALTLLSQSYELKMKPEDAEIVLKKAIALNPMDVASVESLLKIYDQRGESEQSILLLKTLLKNKPEPIAYVMALMSRLGNLGRWDESYQEGLLLVGPVLASSSVSVDEQEKVALLFSQSVYQKGRGLLDRHPLLNEPTVQTVQHFARTQLQPATVGRRTNPTEATLNERLTLLGLDPLTELPSLPSSFQPPVSNLTTALQVAFLSGDLARHDLWLEQTKHYENRLEIAKQLYNIGDYAGAKMIAESVLQKEPNSFEAKDLMENIAESQKDTHDYLTALSMLPRRISDNYWQKAASEALRTGSGDWKTYGQVAQVLERRRLANLALFHQRMAARYAPTTKEKQYWERKANKTARALSLN